jgi:hypothetical protein
MAVMLLFSGASAWARQDKPAPPATPAPTSPARLTAGPLDLSITWRSRFEAWDWYQGTAGNNDYGFASSLLRVALGQQRRKLTWRLELAQPTVLGLPNDAVAPAPLGQLGLGGTYYAANDGNEHDAGLFLKEGFVQFNQIGRAALKLGRFEFFDGTEARIPDATVAAIVQQRVAHRLISNFGFTVAQRSFDGALYTWSRGSRTFAGFGGRATAGVFQVDGMRELDVDIFYGSFTKAIASNGAGSLRVFGIGYRDGRTAVLKVDNRPLVLRTADRESIGLGTFGANYVHVFQTRSAGKVDVLGWAVAQTGSWGAQSHRAAAYVAEAGWQPDVALRPWFRGGYSYGSGDDNPNDGTHGTFFQLLTTPRQYARLPFYNMMNNGDLFGMVTLRPSPKLTLKSEVHALRLVDAEDLWYGGGGPFQRSTFGYAARPSQGAEPLATVWDVSADVPVHPHFTLGLYFGHTSGGDVVKRTYSRSSAGHFAYVESMVRF